jgi:hypothetical protein
MFYTFSFISSIYIKQIKLVVQDIDVVLVVLFIPNQDLGIDVFQTWLLVNDVDEKSK